MHLLQHLAVIEQKIMVDVTALAGGVSTATNPRGDATVIVIIQHQEAVSLPAIKLGVRLRDHTGPTASVAKIHNQQRRQGYIINGCFRQVATVLEALPPVPPRRRQLRKRRRR